MVTSEILHVAIWQHYANASTFIPNFNFSHKQEYGEKQQRTAFDKQPKARKE